METLTKEFFIQEMNRLHVRMDKFEVRLGKMEMRMGKMEKDMKSFARKKDLYNFPTMGDMDRGFEKLRSELADKKYIDKIINAVDGLAKQVKDFNQEMPAVKEQVQGINDWIKKVEPKVGVPYGA